MRSSIRGLFAVGLCALSATVVQAQPAGWRRAVADTSGTLSVRAQAFRDMLPSMPGGADLQINARRLAESVEHVRRQALRGASDTDLARAFERARIDYEFLQDDVATVYGDAPPPPVGRVWQDIRDAYGALSRVMRDASPRTPYGRIYDR
ncbi:MAG: hypothetical protein U0793_10460 [Gemmataceae bacterium]